MPFNGVGQFVSVGSPAYPAVPNTFILASYFNQIMDDIYAGLGSAVTRDGQSPAAANLPMAGFTLSNIRAAAASGEPLNYLQSGAKLKSLQLTEGLTVDAAAVVNFAANLTPTGVWDFRSTSSLLVPTKTLGNNSQAPASTAYVQTEIQNLPQGALPSITGNAGKFLFTDGMLVSWRPTVGTDIFLFQNFGGL